MILFYKLHCCCWDIGCQSNCWSLEVISLVSFTAFTFLYLWASAVSLCPCRDGFVFIYSPQHSLTFLNLSFSVSRLLKISGHFLIECCFFSVLSSFGTPISYVQEFVYLLYLLNVLLNVLFDTLCGALDNFFQSIFQDTNFSPTVSNLPFKTTHWVFNIKYYMIILEIHLLLFQVCLVASNSLLFLSHISKLFLYLPAHIKYVIL